MVIVEDDENLRWLTKRIVERECGFVVVGSATNGAEGLELVTSARPDVAILDLGMPVMDGYEALPLMRLHAPATSIVVYSGRAPEEARDRSLELGAFAYVEKDPSSKALVQALCMAVHQAAALPDCACGSCGPAIALS